MLTLLIALLGMSTSLPEGGDSIPEERDHWLRVHHTSQGATWVSPIQVDGATFFDMEDDTWRAHFTTKEGTEIIVPWQTTDVDSLDVAEGLLDEEKGHNPFRTFAMHINTVAQTPITTREEWIPCHITIDGRGEYSNYSGTGRIRGRGNSSWSWYDKKPYKFKLDSKSKLLGLGKAKDWNLLANYRDVTDIMNTLAFETARYMGMPHTLHTRYLEVFLNGEYIGLYQMTEKIEVDDNRLNIDRERGVLLTLDADDGPSLSPSDGDNFWTSVYRLPMAVKYPEAPSPEQLQQIKSDFAVLEDAIKRHDYTLADSLMDMHSFIGLMQLHEYLYNVEIDAPRSIYLYRDADGKYTWGPVWDWDAGFDFDWSNMRTGHDFFSNYRELIYGTDPVNNVGANYRVSGLWTDLFANSQFVTRYQQQWGDVKDSLYLAPWQQVEKYVAELRHGSYDRELTRWPISGKYANSEIHYMRQWLQNRLRYLNEVIANYPPGNDDVVGDHTVVKTLSQSTTCYASSGYDQWSDIRIDQTQVTQLLGGTPTSLVPLNADGSEGSNTAAGTYGAWFSNDGNTAQWAAGHVFIESDNLWTWNYGCHPSNCRSGHSHTVTMQYRRGTKAVNISVTFTIE